MIGKRDRRCFFDEQNEGRQDSLNIVKKQKLEIKKLNLKK